MQQSAALERLEAELDELSWSEQVWLLERLARRIREQSLTSTIDADDQLAAMADDPDIQRELRQIAEEFAHTEADRLP
jgi:hypothetical protein